MRAAGGQWSSARLLSFSWGLRARYRKGDRAIVRHGGRHAIGMPAWSRTQKSGSSTTRVRWTPASPGSASVSPPARRLPLRFVRCDSAARRLEIAQNATGCGSLTRTAASSDTSDSARPPPGPYVSFVTFTERRGRDRSGRRRCRNRRCAAGQRQLVEELVDAVNAGCERRQNHDHRATEISPPHGTFCGTDLRTRRLTPGSPREAMSSRTISTNRDVGGVGSPVTTALPER
jgi:hypothetical protein